ncbi:DUF4237 domain-containing protein [Amycolatopsis acidicola]|uniref:DUF4237 domain-containing protein n=1 Tax=Amycolatopsis acidicola TaxID=2596893 RepID=A0A5N0V215_9PSEU|nr:TNT domain-containing protein [Amycolatopsis acidicola]KAA9158919.1 DUF4237 domain-containing protein [Amycolatopsis acidicola]
MGIELPKELADVAAATGLSWPQADEDKLREQAGAWRDAQGKLQALAGDADRTAGDAIGALSGPSAQAAGGMWSGYTHPENGELTHAVRGAGEAADRLDDAADKVASTKVEMVRQLVDAAKNRDAAQTAASAGHPTALLGVDTILQGTATNLTSLTDGLAGAVGPEGRAQGEVPVDPNPGTHGGHGQSGLLSTVTGVPDKLLSTVDSAVPVPGESAPAVLVGADGQPPEHPIHDVLPSDRPEVAPPVAPEPAPAQQPLVDDSPATGPIPALSNADAGTGPIQIPVAPHQPAQYGGFLHSGGFDDVPTPATGTPAVHPHAQSGTVASGFTEASFSGSPAAPPPAAPLPPQPIAPAQPSYVAQPPQFGGPPPVAPPAAPGAPVSGGPVPGAPAAGAQQQQQMPFRPRQVAPVPYAPQQNYVPPPPADVPPLGSPRQERESIVALFRVHMFPLGHLPVAADKPARQLPPPPPDFDYAPGLRFPPHDHPQSGLIETEDALSRVREGYARLPTPPAEPPEELTERHDPLGGLHERDWDRRFLVGLRDSVPEYAWPPGELYPEGGREPGEPEILAVGTQLDRFGNTGGRVFAPQGTLFAKRSLPPTALASGYRRYEVLREVPMWWAVSAGWFAQPGGGIRYRSVYSADELVTLGYLADVTFEEGE